MNTYTKNYKVSYADIDRFNELSIVSLIKYLENVAFSHSNNVGFGLDRLHNLNSAWLLCQWIITFDRYPSYNDFFKIKTWISSFNKIRTIREFLILDNANNIYGRAASQWVFFDMKNKKPAKIPQEAIDSFKTNENRAIDFSFSKIEKLSSEDKTKIIEIRRSDIDIYNHVNNKRYIEWMEEVIPDHIYNNYKLTACNILYVKESKYGTTIHSSLEKIDSCNNQIQYLHSITNKDDNTLFVNGKTTWSKKG